MIRLLSETVLPTGESARISLLIPPEPEYTERMRVFLRHKDDENARSLNSRFAGKYADVSVDLYFIAEIGGRVAAQVWFGYGKNDFPIANFGHVYTDPDFRRRGIVNLLMEHLIAEFDRGPAQAAFCTAGAQFLADMYAKFGFRPAHPGTTYGDLMRLCPAYRTDSFAEFEQRYYTPVAELAVIPGSMRFRHEIDRLLDFVWREHGHCERVWVSGAIRGFQHANFLAEDGRGTTFFLQAPNGRIAGWGFALNPFGAGETPIFDYELHPLYRGQIAALLSEAVRFLRRAGHRRMLAAASDCYPEKRDALLAAGFRRQATLPDFHGGAALHLLEWTT